MLLDYAAAPVVRLSQDFLGGSLGLRFDGAISKTAPSIEENSSTHDQLSEDEKSPFSLSFLTSQDEAPPARYDPESEDELTYQPLAPSNRHEPSYLDNSESSRSDFTDLVNSNEPVSSNYGSWGMGQAGDSNHHAAPCFTNYEDESGVVSSSWFLSENDDNVESPHSNSFSEAPPGPYLDHGGGDNGLLYGHTAVKVLKNSINKLKKKIKHFEEEFETTFGYQPSNSEKMKHKNIKKYMSELSKLRKELKQVTNDAPGLVRAPSVFPLSVMRCPESTTPGSQPTVPGQLYANAANTLRQVKEKLTEKRSACGRKENLFEMTSNELQEEKTAIQKALLYYEYLHGRPKTREDKEIAKPLYDRYRQCKRIVLRTESRENMGSLATIVEHKTMDFSQASSQLCGSFEQEEEEEKATAIIPTFEEEVLLNSPHKVEKENKGSSVLLGDLHSLSLRELKERKKENKEENKRLRSTLRDFEEQFEREYGRKVQKEDRGPQEQTYLDYKHSKAKQRLLDALVSKLKKCSHLLMLEN